MTGKPSRTPDFPALLAKADLAGPYRLHPDQAPAALAAARQLGSSVAEIGLDGDFLAEPGTAVAIPEHYGANFDALYDCLTDLAASPGQGCLLLFTGAPAADEDEDDKGSPVGTPSSPCCRPPATNGGSRAAPCGPSSPSPAWPWIPCRRANPGRDAQALQAPRFRTGADPHPGAADSPARTRLPPGLLAVRHRQPGG